MTVKFEKSEHVMNRNIETIPVERVHLTVNYYKEYLGFKLINYVPRVGKMNYALMQIQNKTILFESIDKGKVHGESNKIIDIELNYNGEQMNSLYNNYFQKVKIIKELTKTTRGTLEFTVLDCNNIQIQFKGSNNHKEFVQK
jgi:uncharacterized glyoxalase superfamily protein PhnB